MKNEGRIISIEQGGCIKCGRCVKVCPAGIMRQEEKGGDIWIRYAERCIACGHCVDVCPTGSLVHGLFPPEKVHAIDYSLLPTPEQVMLLIKSRRSNRTMTSRPVPQEMLDQIVEAAGYAPTAKNARQVSFTVIDDPEKLRWIADFTIDTFTALTGKLKNPLVKCLLKPFLQETYKHLPLFDVYKKRHEEGHDPILRKSTALLVFHTPESSDFGSVDANLAYQNASLMAQSLGVSQIYMGFVMMAIRQGRKGKFKKMLGIDGKVQAIMALGMPAFKYLRYTERS